MESESAAKHTVYYTVSGPGYNQHPVNVFALESQTGKLSVLQTIDREEFPSFTVRLGCVCAGVGGWGGGFPLISQH